MTTKTQSFHSAESMDHFPIFGGGLKGLIDIGSLGGLPYDNQGFGGFPGRAGLGEEITDGVFAGNSALLHRKPSEYAAFIQSWLYWGLLSECLQQHIQMSDFLEESRYGEQRLTTAKLELYLVVWAERLATMEPDEIARYVGFAKTALSRTIFLLAALSARIEKPCKNSASDPNGLFWQTHGCEILPPDLELSICALGYAISHTISVVSSELNPTRSEGMEGAHWYTPPFLLRLLRIYQFCESDMKYFTDDTYGFTTAIMAVSACRELDLPKVCRDGDHSKCTTIRCEADNIDNKNYKMVHVKDDCSCSAFVPQQGWNEMLRIVEDGGIPLARLKFKSADLQEQPTFEVLSADPGVEYVAFSHVWAGGRGNMTGNDLFKCQWRWLQECAQQYRSSDSHSEEDAMPFWIDTFCVPRGFENRVMELRKKSILMMPRIYRSAEAVIVVDSAFENANPEMSVLEFGLRLKFCAWSRRVWTLHEGAVAKEVKFSLANGLVSMTTVYHQLATARYPIRDGSGWNILQAIEKEYVFAVLPGCIMTNRLTPDAHQAFFFTWRELKARATTLETDRYLVMGIINQVDEKTLSQLQRAEKDKADLEAARRAKLKLVLFSATMIPQGIIFTLDKRFDDPGMRWAPSTIGAEIPDDLSHASCEKWGENGAVVKYNGWRIGSSFHDVSASTFLLVQPDRGDAAHERRKYRLAVWPTDEKRKSLASVATLVNHGSALAIILSDVPGPDTSYVNYQRALLVEEHLAKSGSGSGNVVQQSCMIEASYIAVLRVWRDDQDGDSCPELQASWVDEGFEQRWCVK